MTVHAAEDKLVEKYPAYLKDKAELAEIVAYLSKYGEGDIDTIWDSFRLSYGFASAPRLAVFHKAANDTGARFKEGNGKRYEFVCYICGARFPLSETMCRSCKNTDKAWRSVILEGGYRTGKLKSEIEKERETLKNERMGNRDYIQPQEKEA